MKTYEIRYADKVVGHAQVSIEGLYYKFFCRCNLPDKVLHRIYICAEGKEINLGVCMPNHGDFTLEKKVPKKYFGSGELSFYIGQKPQRKDDRILPVSEDKPFSKLVMLGSARFVIHEGKPCIRFDQEVGSDASK